MTERTGRRKKEEEEDIDEPPGLESSCGDKEKDSGIGSRGGDQEQG